MKTWAKAITATARKLAILVYRTLKDGLVYRDPRAAVYDAQHRTRVIDDCPVSDVANNSIQPTALRAAV